MTDLDISYLVGCKVEAVESLPGSPCSVRLSGGHSLNIECLWRLRENGRILCTSLDSGHLFGRLVAVDAIGELCKSLVSKRITNVELQIGTSDLILQFGAVALEALNSSSGYEAWQLSGPSGSLVVALGGGELAVWD